MEATAASKVTPGQIAVTALAQLAPDGAYVIPEETEKDITPGVFGFAVVAVFINGKPVDRVAILVRPVGIALVMLHMDGVVIRLGKTACDRLCHPEESVEQGGAKEGVIGEVVPDAVDVRIDHQRIEQAGDQHHP